MPERPRSPKHSSRLLRREVEVVGQVVTVRAGSSDLTVNGSSGMDNRGRDIYVIDNLVRCYALDRNHSEVDSLGTENIRRAKAQG